MSSHAAGPAADGQTRRQAVSGAIAAMLPASQPSESEKKARAEKYERVRSRPEPGDGP